MNISDDFKCIFIHIPKAAGTSVKEALHLEGQGHPPWHYFANNFPTKWKSYHKFTIVRNPWARVVSAYSYAKMKDSYWHNEKAGLHPDYELLKDKNFAQCCQLLLHERHLLTHESWHSQHLWITNTVSGKPVLAVNNILRCESLNSDFNQFCKILGIAEKKLPHTNKSNHMHYRKYYNTKTKKIIAKLYRTDAEVFGYRY